MFTFVISDGKYPFWVSLVQKAKIISLSWNLVLTLIQTCRVQWWCSRFLFFIGNAIFWQIWSKKLKLSLKAEILQILIASAKILNKMRTLEESEVSFVNQGTDEGRWVKDIFVLPQGFSNYPSVFLWARWHIYCAWVAYSRLKQWWLVFVRGVIGQWAVV